MPKRVIDFDAMWASDKLASCAEWAQAEYAWFYGLADASGCFELTNLRVIWGRVAAIRNNLTLERVTAIFEEFAARGLLFTWEQNGKRYGHWTGSDVPGRLPAPSWRARLERLAPPIPREQLTAYMARFGARRTVTYDAGVARADEATAVPAADAYGGTGDKKSAQLGLKLGLEEAQAQDLDLNLDLDGKKKREETQVCAFVPSLPFENDRDCEEVAIKAEPWRELPESLLEIYEAERGVLPRADGLSEERRRNCALRLGEGLTLEMFRAAVRRAAATPFLAGAGERGWRANFDWLIANETNVRKVLEGRYDPPAACAAAWQGSGSGIRAAARGGNARASADAYVGAGPVASAVGARVKPATLERIRLREAAQAELRGIANSREKAS